MRSYLIPRENIFTALPLQRRGERGIRYRSILFNDFPGFLPIYSEPQLVLYCIICLMPTKLAHLPLRAEIHKMEILYSPQFAIAISLLTWGRPLASIPHVSGIGLI